MSIIPKIVKLKGGLGNQMFQYAFARLLQERHGCNVILDFTYYGANGVDNVRQAMLQRMNTRFSAADAATLRKVLLFQHNYDPRSLAYRIMVGLEAILNPKYYFEKNRNEVNAEHILHHTYFDGYWQSYSYLEPIRHLLIDEFKCSSLSAKTQQVMLDFRSRNSVFVGVRRGDYITDKRAKKRFTNIEPEYYRKAIAYIKAHVANPVFIFFSIDIPWVKKHLNCETLQTSPESIIYREPEDITDDFEELYVMSSCRHAIIANSTYNFWGAWLIDHEKKIVVAPRCWYNNGQATHALQPGWITL